MLTDTAIRKAKPDDRHYKLNDSGGLYLLVTNAGGKLWRFDYRFDEKRKTLALGKYPDTSLLDARERHNAARKQLANNKDPQAQKVAKKREGTNFEKLGRRWLANKKPSWVPKYYSRILKRFDDDIFPRIGNLVASQIEPPVLLKHIRAIEARGAIETARRLNGQCGEIFRFGIAEGICSRDPSADIRDALVSANAVKHVKSLSVTDLPRFLQQLKANNELDHDTNDAMWLTILTIARTNEIRFADVSEFEGLDGDEPLWRVPPERMKKSRPHLVPLSRQAAEIVKRRLAYKSEGLLFAHSTRSGTISENTMLFGLYRLGYKGKATMHGFRSTFSTIANESNWNSDWIELALAHAPGNKIRSTYNGAKYLTQRRELLQWWADFLDETQDSVTAC